MRGRVRMGCMHSWDGDGKEEEKKKNLVTRLVCAADRAPPPIPTGARAQARPFFQGMGVDGIREDRGRDGSMDGSMKRVDEKGRWMDGGMNVWMERCCGHVGHVAIAHAQRPRQTDRSTSMHANSHQIVLLISSSFLHSCILFFLLKTSNICVDATPAGLSSPSHDGRARCSYAICAAITGNCTSMV